VFSDLGALSPLDGRYYNSAKELNTYFSEAALMQYRIYVEVEYLLALSKQKEIRKRLRINDKEQSELRKLYQSFDLNAAKEIKEIETKINHDVKAIEYYIQNKTRRSLHPWIHFALTSEDVNNISYSLMWKHALEKIYLPHASSLQSKLLNLIREHRKSPMLSLTHGQPATPTTFGKEIRVFYNRIERQIVKLEKGALLAKMSGATGTWSAHNIAFASVDWFKFTSKFVMSLGLKPNLVTTQIEPHDSIAESYQNVLRLNLILKDLCQDMWLYISRGIISQKKLGGEVGSSTMPHKVNPIQFENAEGNIGISNALLSHMSQKLPISRMQRDLTDSTVLRNQGIALGYSLVSIKSILKGVSRISLNLDRTMDELNRHWEVLGEAIQTMLRREGLHDAYERLKNLTRGENIDNQLLKKFIKDLDLSKSHKKRLLSLSPQKYIGLSTRIADRM
tara:strand:- start:208 stop:1557 length:1350 start_codon:yes stop_codon:yes gene_type:complete